MMNLFYFALFCQFLLQLTSGINNNYKKCDPTDEVTLRLNILAPKELIFNLKKTDTFLANNNLPIFTVKGDKPDQLIPEKNVMNKLGRFTTYQDRELSSAAVYFHQRCEFDGIIDTRFIIRNLSIDSIDNTIQVYSEQNLGVQKRNDRYQHRRSISTENQVNKTIFFTDDDKLNPTRGNLINKTESSTRVKRDLPDIVYLKVLLIVGPDIVKELYGNADNQYTPIVSYLLTQFNNIDMLYSKIERPKIKINVAAIIMGLNEESFPFLKGCYKPMNNYGVSQIYLDISCIDSAIQLYVQTNLKLIPPNSYDMAIYITSLPLWYDKINAEVIGTTNPLEAGPYILRQSSQLRVPSIIFRDTKDFATFVSLAHEIAHALGYPLHDQAPFVDENGVCCSFIMRPHGFYCKNCLSWSPDIIQHFEEFFSSRDGCFFTDKPISLEKPLPQKLSSANLQCQCYGFKRAKISKWSFIDNFCRINKICDNNLHCIDDNGNIHTAPYPHDGTQCGKSNNKVEKVCWSRTCVPISYQDNIDN
ncbi:hypothetical protein PV327_010849 [Microctonus hyperodae]|uniref:Peptidase M12B domain-containing protein n=1 Tax=Microctonus hyperodae TaxID=165561 RepID=A0AA39C8B2_MICHY|nr:hypothetical protein PV327_010849 [Microctonus hyperodae]